MTAPAEAARRIDSEPAFEAIPAFRELGITAFTTTRDVGSFNLGGREPVGDVYGRWWQLFERLGPLASRMASAHQVHGTEIALHRDGWEGWLRLARADGHIAVDRPTAMIVTIADCVPVFIAHPSGAAAILHAGWRGTAADILAAGVKLFSDLGFAPRELHLHLGPSICGKCYTVGPDVYFALTGESVSAPAVVDLRAVLARQARSHGVERLTVSESCTRCNNDRFFSHRAGDDGRQVSVIVSRIG